MEQTKRVMEALSMRNRWSGLIGAVVAFWFGGGVVTAVQAQPPAPTPSASGLVTLDPIPMPTLSQCRDTDVLLKHAEVVAILELAALSPATLPVAEEQFKADVESFQQARAMIERGECLGEGAEAMTQKDFDEVYRPILVEYALAEISDLNSVLPVLKRRGVRVTTQCTTAEGNTLESFSELTEGGFLSARCCKVRFCAPPDISPTGTF